MRVRGRREEGEAQKEEGGEGEGEGSLDVEGPETAAIKSKGAEGGWRQRVG